MSATQSWTEPSTLRSDLDPEMPTVHRTPETPDAPVEAAPAASPRKAGPVLGAYRLGLHGIETVTIGVGGLALGSLSKVGLPAGFVSTLTDGHARRTRHLTRFSDTVGTTAARAVGNGVAAVSGAARFLFP